MNLPHFRQAAVMPPDLLSYHRSVYVGCPRSVRARKTQQFVPEPCSQWAIIARGIEQEVEEVCSESANVAAIIVPFGPGGSPARIDAVALLRLDSIGDSQESRSHLQAQYKPVKTIIGVPMISLHKLMHV